MRHYSITVSVHELCVWFIKVSVYVVLSLGTKAHLKGLLVYLLSILFYGLMIQCRYCMEVALAT